MAENLPKIRLYVAADLQAGAEVALDAGQAHYLSHVMRLAPGGEVALFNGRDGEWRATLGGLGRRGGTAMAVAEVRPQRNPPDLWLLFAPVKKARTDFIVEKAAELGAARILPVLTQFTNAERVRADRLRAHAIEAAEQCAGTFVPEVAEAASLAAVLAGWPAARRLVFCDESGQAPPLPEVLAAEPAGPWAILTGPEGGFSPDEAARLRALPFLRPAGLGPRILRADTAAVAALAVWQALAGDWDQGIGDG
jgi:16S rRNA (uracil1498-N3)-methyltransferase